jgi:hypothetical protein
MGGSIENVGEGATPLAINEGFFLKHPVSAMPVSSGIDVPEFERIRHAVVRVVCWRGLLALSLGLSANFPDDHVMLEHGLTMYDAPSTPGVGLARGRPTTPAAEL